VQRGNVALSESGKHEWRKDVPPFSQRETLASFLQHWTGNATRSDLNKSQERLVQKILGGDMHAMSVDN